MALTTLTYEALGRRYQRQEDERLKRIAAVNTEAHVQFEKHEPDPSVYRRLQEISQRARTYIEEVLQPEWQAIRQQAEDSILDQIEHYNADHSTASMPDEERINPWAHRFVFLSCIPKEQQVQRLKNVHRSKSELLMRAFSSPEFYVLSRDEKQSMTDTPIEACIPQADQIPDELAEELGLVTFAEGDAPEDRLHKKEDISCTTHLKEIIERSQPLSPGNFRFLELEDGRLLYTREEPNGRNRGRIGPPKLMAQVYSSVYEARRKTLHQQESYDSEMPILSEMKVAIQRMNSRLNREWKPGTPEADKQALWQEVQQTLAHWHDRLRLCTNLFKVQARSFMGTIASLSYEQGKKHISARMSQMVATVIRFERRNKDIFSKDGYNQKDYRMLHQKVLDHEQWLVTFRTNVQRGAQELDTDSLLFSEDQLGAFQIDQHAASLRRKMGFSKEDLDEVTLEPFRTYAKRLQEKCDVLDQALLGRNREAAKDTVVQMHVIGKFQGVRRCFEEIQTDILDPGHAPISLIADKIKRMREYFDHKQIDPLRSVPGYEDSFREMSQQLAHIESTYLDGAVNDMDIDARTPLYRELKEYLDTFKPEEIVRQLP